MPLLKNNAYFLRLIAIVVLLCGVFISIFFGQSLKDNAEKAWFTKVTETAEQATDSCLFWFALQQMQLRGVASLFYGSDSVTEDEFFKVLDLIEVPDSLPLHSIAYAVNQTTPYISSYLVTLSSDTDSMFSSGVDIAQNKQILSAITTAHSFPGEVVMSSPFINSQGNLMSCLLMTMDNSNKADVLMATINVLDLIEDLTTLHVPDGLHLQNIRMTAMTDGVPQQTEFFQSSISSIPSIQNFHIRVDSGKAHLDYTWGGSTEFLGGPVTELGGLVQVAGSIFSLMLFTAMLFLVKENVRVRQKVQERTIELSTVTERLKALSDASFEAIILSENGICLDLNNTAVNMFGYSKEEAIGSLATIIFAPEQMKTVKNRIQTSDDTPYEVIATRKDGSVLPVLIQGRTIGHFGKNIRVTAINDITDRKNAEVEKEKLTEQLQQAKKMESIGLMAGGVAHDLNNILSGIVGYPELLLQKLPQESDLRKPIEAIHESGQRAATVVADLLTVARGVATTKETHNISSLIQEYLASPECDKLKSLHPNIIWQHNFKAIHTSILCSSVHVKKSLMNLVINAAEAVDDNGTVVVSTRNQCIDEIESSEYKIEKGDYVVLSVNDTGPGITNVDLEHIFEPFYTKKKMGRSGTGLGLTVVWNTMKDHSGKVLVESSNAGTCFQLYFPVSSNEKTTIRPPNKISPNLSRNNEHVLIVDDEPQLLDIASQILRPLGYTVDTVDSGALAIEFVKKKPVDLIVMDMLMEPGINGRQTYEEIIKLYPNQKAIIASGFSDSEDVKAALRLGAGGFIKKPYTIDQLSRTVKEALSS